MSTSNFVMADIGLSVASISESIYAVSALHSYLYPSDKELPPMLVPGHREALNRLISLAAAAVAVDLPEIAADVTSVDDGVIRMSLLVPSGDLSIMRRGIEEAVQSWVLHNCYLCGRSRAAESYEREYKARIKALKEKAGASAAVPRLRPSRY